MTSARSIAVMFDNFGPYHVARLAAASTLADVIPLQVRSKSTTYDWTGAGAGEPFSTHTLVPSGPVTFGAVRAALDAALAGRRPDVIAIPGWAAPASLAALDWAVSHAVPTIVMSDSNAFDAPRRWPSEAVKRHLVGLFDAGFAAGSLAAAYLVQLGLDDRRIEMGYDVVDNAHFAAAVGHANASSAMPETSPGTTFGPAHRGRYFLACARLVKKKNIPQLVSAYATYRALYSRSMPGSPWPLVIVGDGEERPEIETRVRELGLEGEVHLPGFQQYEALPLYYATAGAFVHPSRVEQWGLVINEAMASGLPVAVSNRCGAAADLVVDGRTGVLFDPTSIDDMAAALHRIAHNIDRTALVAAGCERISEWGPERFASGLTAAASHAFTAQRRAARGLRGQTGRALIHVLARLTVTTTVN